jgi:hypothetical protein
MWPGVAVGATVGVVCIAAAAGVTAGAACAAGNCVSTGKPRYSTGASNCAHHFGRALAGTFAEQLILHDCVSHANRPPLLTAASGAAAALAAGDDNDGGPEGDAVCGAAGPTMGSGSFFEDKLPVAHPASAKRSKAAACLMTCIQQLFLIFV